MLTKADRELNDYLLKMMYALSATERGNSKWVMSRDWAIELETRNGWEGVNLGYLYGIPVEVTLEGGFPHLEPVGNVLVDPVVPPHGHTCNITGQEIADRLIRYLRGGGSL